MIQKIFFLPFGAFHSVIAAAIVCLSTFNQYAMSEPASSSPKIDPAITKTEPKMAIPTDAELRKRLTPEQYKVTKQNGTELPFTNEYWKHNAEGIYVDLISGKPLFSSKDKFDTECGWPGFAKPIDAAEIKNLADNSLGRTRVEVRSKTGDAHLGHVFNDGPKEMGGLRYCINSAAIRFVPKDKMAEAGYGEWLKDFALKEPAKAAPAAEKPKGK